MLLIGHRMVVLDLEKLVQEGQGFDLSDCYRLVKLTLSLPRDSLTLLTTLLSYGKA